MNDIVTPETECFFCGDKFNMANGEYDGEYIPRYKVSVCKPCYKGNWDGWGPSHEEKLLSHLQEKDILIPARNSKGWLPRD